MGRRCGALGASLAIALAGCAQQVCDFHSHGACIQFTYDYSGVQDVQGRIDRLLENEMPFWGLHGIAGWTIQFRDTNRYNCYLVARNSGCTDYFERVMSVEVAPEYHSCFEAAQLLHELGHYTLGDPTHSDARWHGVPDAFAQMVWDRPDAAPECVSLFKGVTAGMWPVHFDGF